MTGKKIPPIAIISFIIIYAISRLDIIFDKIARHLDFSLIIIPIIGFVSLFIFGKYVTKFLIRMIVLMSIALIIFIFSPQMVEENRTFWVPQWQNVVSSVHNLPSSEIFVIDETGIYRWHRVYPIQGDHFQHSLEKGSRDELFSILNDKNKINTIPEYVTMMCRAVVECEDSITEFKFELEKNGYQEMARDQHAIIFKLTK